MKTTQILLLVLLFGCTTNPVPTWDLVIANVNVIDGTGAPLQNNVNVYIKDATIIRIDAEAIKNSDANVIDGMGKYLMPGLIDAHAHPAPIEENFPRFIHYGVTSIFVPGCGECSNEHYAQMRQLGEQDTFPAPRVYHTSQHFTMEGRHPIKTYPSPKWVNGETVFLLEDTLQIEGFVKEVAQYPIKGIKVTIEDGPDPPFVDRMPQAFVTKIVNEAKKYDLEVFAHVSDMEEVRIAQRAGVQNIVHFVGVDIVWERDEEVINALIADSVSWVTTLMIDKSFSYPLNPNWLNRPEIIDIYDAEEIARLSNPNRAERSKQMLFEFYGLENPTLERVILPQTEDIKILAERGCNVVLGTDTGNDFIFPGFSMHEEMQLMELGGFEPMEIIKMATHNGAKMLKVLDKTGTVEVGKFADMILLNRNPLESISNTLSIDMVIKNGKIQKRLK